MKLTKQQKDIIKRINSGEIRDIPSYINTYNLSTFIKLNKEEINERMKKEENGKTYKTLKSGVQTMVSTTQKDNVLGINIPRIKYVSPSEEDYEYVPAVMNFYGSSKKIEIGEDKVVEFDFFGGINVTKSFNCIKDFLTIWQFLKLEGLVLEVDKEVEKEDYECFFEYKPIMETKFGKRKNKMKSETVDIQDVIEWNEIPKESQTDYSPFLPSLSSIDASMIKDYRNYIDYNFEYNKSNELICSQFINKQIYGNTALELFIKNKFKTEEERNLNKSLIPAYLALILTLVIEVWDNNFSKNKDIVQIQNQLSEIQNVLDTKTYTSLDKIENTLQKILETNNNSTTGKKLKESSEDIQDN